MLEVGSPPLPPLSPSELVGTGGSEDETSLFFTSLFFPLSLLPSVPVGSGKEAVDDTSDGMLLEETLVGGTVEEVGSTGGEDGTAWEFCPPSATVI